MARKKKYVVIPREQKVTLDGVTTEHGHKDFSTKTPMLYVNEDEAKDIDQKYGLAGGSREVYVAEDQQYSRALNNDGVGSVHNYHFTGVDMSRIKPSKSDYEWVETSAGRYKRVKRSK